MVNDNHTNTDIAPIPSIEEPLAENEIQAILTNSSQSAKEEIVPSSVSYSDNEAGKGDSQSPTNDQDQVKDLSGNKPKQNVTFKFPYSEIVADSKSSEITVVLPADFESRTNEILEKLPNIRLLDSPNSRQWASDVKEGMRVLTYGDEFEKTLQAPDGDFKQYIDHNGEVLEARNHKFKPIENQTLSGERALIRIMSYLGMGTLFQTPLWNTGIWVTFKAPTEGEIVELNRVMIADKIEFGRHTYGLSFSNVTSYTIERIINFIFDHIYETTLDDSENPGLDLRNVIVSQDIPSLIWGFVCTMYPKGFNYRRACVNDPERCNHVIQELLNLSKLLWVNNAALTPWQKTHMAIRRPRSKKLNQIERYKEEMVKSQKRKITFNKDESNEIFITLKSPTLSEYIDAGHKWISSITELVEKTLGLEASDSERNIYIQRHGQASSMRQYVHWIDSIEFGEGNIINDQETIDSTCELLSANDDVRVHFINEVLRYISDSEVAVVGIPVFECPNCGMEQKEKPESSAHKNVIPLDVVQLFFVQLTQRLARIVER